MKKCFAVLFTAVLAAALCVSAFADNEPLVKVLMSSEGTVISTPIEENYPELDELGDAVEEGEELIPDDAQLVPGRLTILGTGHVSNDEREVYDVSFKVWSTAKRSIGLFFRADDSDTWELITCNLGDIIEGRFQAPGDYAIAVGW